MLRIIYKFDKNWQMAMECVGNCIFLDGHIVAAVKSNDFTSGDVSFYEVIRTRQGVPLFFDDHMKRLEEGILTRYKVSSDIASQVRYGLNSLVSHERYDEINVRVTVTFTGKEYSLLICYIHSSYPTEAMVREGVPLIFYHAERQAPGVKIMNARLRLAVNEELERRKAFEALLVNHRGLITEGSRSNIFFISRDGIIHTAPDSMVLSGITRKYVTQIIRDKKMSLTYKAVRSSQAGNYRSAFITGTSPMVLAVRSIEDYMFDVSDPLIGKLREAYCHMADQSILGYKEKNKT
jgi:branched-chain amino acid aminotransferase